MTGNGGHPRILGSLRSELQPAYEALAANV